MLVGTIYICGCTIRPVPVILLQAYSYVTALRCGVNLAQPRLNLVGVSLTRKYRCKALPLTEEISTFLITTLNNTCFLQRVRQSRATVETSENAI